MNSNQVIAEQVPIIIELGGYLYDGNGEKVGMLAADGTRIFFAEAKSAWTPATKDDLDYLIQKRNELAAVAQMERDRYAAVIERLQEDIARAEKNLKDFDNRYFEPIAEIAKQHLPSNRRAYKSPFGEVQFVEVPSALKTADTALALAWAQIQCVDAFFEPAPQFLISKVPKETKAALMAMDAKVRAEYGFMVTEAGERIDIKT